MGGQHMEKKNAGRTPLAQLVLFLLVLSVAGGLGSGFLYTIWPAMVQNTGEVPVNAFLGAGGDESNCTNKCDFEWEQCMAGCGNPPRASCVQVCHVIVNECKKKVENCK